MFVSDRDTADYLQERAVTGFKPLAQPGVRDGFMRLQDAWNTKTYEDLSTSRGDNLRWEYDRTIDHIQQVTGQRLENPVRLLDEGPTLNPVDLLGDAASNALFGHDWALSSRGRYHQRVEAFESQVAQLAAQFPGLQPRSRQQMDETIAARAAQFREAAAAGVDVGFAGLGRFVGEAEAVMADPINQASMLFGGAATVRNAAATLTAKLAQIGKAAAVEGGVSMATEAMIQPAVYDYKQDLKSPYGVGDAVENVAMAGAVGAGLGGALEGAGIGLRGLLKRWRKAGAAGDPEARVAAAVVEDAIDKADSNPFPDGMDFEVAHARAFDEAAAAAIYGEAPKGRTLDELRAHQRQRIQDFIVYIADPGNNRPARKKPDAIHYARMAVGEAEDLAAVIKRETGRSVDLASAVRRMDEDGIKHALKGHSGDALPLTRQDLELVPDIVRTGELIKADIGKTGLVGLEYRKLVDGHWLHVHEELRGRSLVFTTAYRNIGPNKKPGADLAPGLADLRRYADGKPFPEASRDSNINPFRDGDKAAPLPPSLREPASKPVSLTQWVKNKGGLVNESGELSQMGLTAQARPGAVNQQGMTLDDAARAAWEDGFFHASADRPDINTFLDALREDFTGTKQYSIHDQGLAAAWDEVRARLAEIDGAGIDARGLTDAEVNLRLADQRLRTAFADLGDIGITPTDADLAELAARMLDEGHSADALAEDWIERAAIQWYENDYRLNAQEPDDGDIPFEPFDRRAEAGQGVDGPEADPRGPGSGPERRTAPDGPEAGQGFGGFGEAPERLTTPELRRLTDEAQTNAPAIEAMADRDVTRLLADVEDLAVPLPGMIDEETGAAVTRSARDLLADADDAIEAADLLRICTTGSV